MLYPFSTGLADSSVEILLLFAAITILGVVVERLMKKKSSKLPPGPWGLPLIGKKCCNHDHLYCVIAYKLNFTKLNYQIQLHVLQLNTCLANSLQR